MIVLSFDRAFDLLDHHVPQALNGPSNGATSRVLVAAASEFFCHGADVDLALRAKADPVFVVFFLLDFFIGAALQPPQPMLPEQADDRARGGGRSRRLHYGVQDYNLRRKADAGFGEGAFGC